MTSSRPSVETAATNPRNTAAVNATPSIDDLPPQRPRAPGVVERDRSDERTASWRLARLIGRVADEAVAVMGLSLMLIPALAIALLTLDRPATLFDGFVDAAALRPSNWTAHGDLVFLGTMFAVILMTRRFGARTVSRAVGFSWVIVLLLSVGMLVYLAPQLSPADMPRGRYMVALVSGAYLGATLAAHIYDLTRGGRWWRAPLLAGVLGAIAHSLLQFVLGMAGQISFWPIWLVGDLVLRITLVLGFVGVYGVIRKRIKPRAGLGGR